METTVQYAETHLAQLLIRVERGEEVILRNGAEAVARIVPFPHAPKRPRPQVGELTSAPVKWDDASFAPLDEAGMKNLHLVSSDGEFPAYGIPLVW